MIHSQSTKKVLLISPASYVASETATGSLDTLGFDYCTIDVALGAQTGATTRPTEFNLTEGTNTSAASAIVAFNGGTETSSTVGFVIPSGSGTVAPTTIYTEFNVDLKGRNRYLKLDLSPGTTVILGAVATLSRGKEFPVGTTEQNCRLVVNG
jgi:hypothetical protein